MPKYVITRTYKHTETIEVEAQTKGEAWAMSNLLDGKFVRNNDDWLYDEDVDEVKHD